jgi:hypothetical protein
MRRIFGFGAAKEVATVEHRQARRRRRRFMVWGEGREPQGSRRLSWDDSI